MFSCEFCEISHNIFFKERLGLDSTHSNICDWVFLAKIAYSLKPLSNFAKKLHCDVRPGFKYVSVSSH